MQQQSVSVVKDYGSRAQRALFEKPAPGEPNNLPPGETESISPL